MSTLRRSKKRERYSRNTMGFNAQGFFSPAGTPQEDYPTAAENTISEIVHAAPALAGLIGIYNAANGALISGLPAAGVVMKVVQKNSDGDLKKSTELVVGNFTVEKTNYVAPVIQVDNVSPLNINIVGGLQEFVLSIRERTPGNQPFPVMEGRAIVRGGSPDDYAIAGAIAADIANSYDFERNADNAFAIVDITADEAVTALAAGNLTFSKGSVNVPTSANYSTPLAVGNYLGVTTASGVASGAHSWFKVTAVTATQVTLDRPWPYDYEVIAGATDGLSSPTLTNVGLRVSGIDELVHFDTAVSEDLADAVITHTTAWLMGSGAAYQMAAMEDEAVVFDGQTTINVAHERDYGVADLYVNDDGADQYVTYVIESLNRVIPSAGAPNNQTLAQANIVIAAIVGSSLESTLDTVFGV
jgi:hypothetical protein